jgi:CDP-glucose 4,6-dehydratase
VESLVAALSAYRGRRVFVTGTTGFKGSWLSTWLAELGADVAGFALPPADDAPLFGQLRCAERIRQTYGDVRDLSALRAALEDFAPEVIIHLAAQALVRRSYEQPLETFGTNVTGGINLLEAIRRVDSVRSLVFITSDKCYLNKEWQFSYRENDELGGADPYSASKAAMELAFASYQQSFFAGRMDFAAATARAGNVIGGGDFSRDRIVPDCVRALSAGAPIVLRNPDATRPWQHVLEPLSGYLMLGARLLNAAEEGKGAWNFAPDAENVRTVHQLTQQMVAVWGSGEIVVDRPAEAVHEAQLLMLSSDKAKRQLGWRPRWNFREAIGQTVNWYREVGQGGDPVAVTRRQIADYVKAAS